jgi:hypothetical protein
MLESKIERDTCEYAKSKNYLCYKLASIGKKGYPDREFISQNGCLFKIEFKKDGKKPTKLQEKVISDMMSRGTLVYVVDNLDLGKKLVDHHLFNFKKLEV